MVTSIKSPLPNFARRLSLPPAPPCRRRLYVIVGFAIGLILFSAVSVTHDDVRTATLVRAREMWTQQTQAAFSVLEPQACDPTATHGYVHPDGYWQSVDPDCPSEDIATHLVNTPRTQLWDDFPSYRNKSVLLLGDSVARHVTEAMCGVLGGETESRTAPGWDVPYADAVICTVAELGMKIVNFHTYGLANASDPTIAEILSKGYPGSIFAFEQRLPRLFGEIIPGFKPDYIQVSGGAWDFLYMYTKDILNKERHDDIPAHELRVFGARLGQYFTYLGNLFPEAKLTFMHMARIFPADYHQKMTWGNKHLGLNDGNSLAEHEYPPLLTVRRQAQYMATMRQAVDVIGVDTVDYAKIHHAMSDDEFYTPNENVHPYYQARRVMAGMILQKLQRFVNYGL